MAAQLQPAVFVSHGSPMVAIESGAYQQALADFGRQFKPSAIVVISAHWDSGRTVCITSAERNSLIYDFGGFPQALYQVRYDAPGSPALAAQIADNLKARAFDVLLDPQRGLDHGAWVPLSLMFPKADIPVVEVSIPTSFAPEHLCDLGKMLASLRHQGVLLLGSGGIVHNLRTVDFRQQHRPPEPWALAFDQWFAENLARRDNERLLNYRSAPHSESAVPTPEHFLPVYAVIGAAEDKDALENIFEGFEYGTISMRSFAFR